MKWLKDLISPKTRRWEEFYRNRWQHDKVIRSTHGVNCTGGCSWNIYVKDGIVTWEMQAVDYPLIDRDIPPYEPRGCQRGISYSWYLYSPIRVKYPYVRGALIDLWRKARAQHDDPVEAWASIQRDPDARTRYQRARGKGGFRRVALSEAIEILAASNIYTIRKYGPDRIVGFSPIPAMSQLSYAAGARMLQLMGGINLSFYDWYCDLPPASPETWGEQTDVAESADWYHSKMIAVMGSNPNMTRTPDCHYIAECRHNGSKLVVFSPDFNQVAKYADQWVALNAGQDGAYWMAVTHVILKEYYLDNPTPSFEAYVKQYSDCPFLIELEPTPRGYRAGQMLRAGRLADYADEENPDWKFLMFDATSGKPRMPLGCIGHRWQKQKGKWNIKLEDGKTGEPIDPLLSLLDTSDDTAMVEFEEYESDRIALRGVPTKKIRTADGKQVVVATVFDLLCARYGVDRGLEGEYPKDYDDEAGSYTPAWQERFSGVDRKTVIEFAREWAHTAKATDGKCCIIIGAGINHWYHNNLMYRSGIVALILTGCVGKNGGGLNHYVGQEKLAPAAPWAQIAFARDWAGPPRLQNAPSWHYVHSDQWRYEANFTDYCPVPGDASLAKGHTLDLQIKAVKAGWLPFFPQFNQSSIELCKEARANGAQTKQDIVDYAVKKLASGELKLSVTDPDAEENWPRVWYIWRGNALMSSAKGHEYFNKHYLGTHSNAIADERFEGHVTEAEIRDAPEGKFDLICDLNFRMDTSALYSDVILPAATWYEKADINSTDMHSYIHPLSEACPPAWESRSDWDLFREITRVTQDMAARHFSGPVEDLVMTALAHDSAAEIAQSEIPKDWSKGECEAIPGKTMPNLTVVERDYGQIYDRYCALGPNVRDGKIGAHGVSFSVKEEYEEMLETRPKVSVGGEWLPSLYDAEHAADAILHLAPETNGEIAYKGYLDLEEKTGLSLVEPLAEKQRSQRTTYKELQAQPRRLLNSPVWSGLVTNGRSYSAFLHQVEHLVPWRTLTGRQHLYLDHRGYIDFGEHLPTYKPTPLPADYGDLRISTEDGIALNYLTPHGKWHIHSTYGDTHRMLTLSRGGEPVWMNEQDAEAIGIVDNDWVEVHNDHGVVCTRAVVSHRIPRGVCIIYHSPERTINVPKSNLRKGRRAGGHNSLTRVRLKPNLMVGGYGQFTYHFNYWGPTGVNRDTTVRIRKMQKVEF